MNDQTTNINAILETAPELMRGPTWLREKRQASRKIFNNSSLPRRGLHLWRYTDPNSFLSVNADKTTEAVEGKFSSLEQLELNHLQQGHLSAVVTDLGGRDIRVHESKTVKESGVIICPLSDAVEQHSELVSRHLYSLVNDSSGLFEALNSALWNDGIFIYVPDRTVLEKPLHLLREARAAGSVQYPRLLVVVGEDAEVTLVDEYGGGTTDPDAGYSYSNGAVEIVGMAGSRTRYVYVQKQTAGAQSYLTHRAIVHDGASMMTIPLSFGAFISKNNFGVILNGPGADSRMYGLLFGGERQHFDNHTLHHHAAGQTTSNIDFKVVLKDRANSAYTGLIRIDKTARVCEAYQENRNLLLSPGTKAATIPELEILNEEVSCSHGATAGPIDPMQMFQLQSRGIRERDAVRMIVSGFIAQSLKLVPEDLRERITELVEQRLEEM